MVTGILDPRERQETTKQESDSQGLARQDLTFLRLESLIRLNAPYAQLRQMWRFLNRDRNNDDS